MPIRPPVLNPPFNIVRASHVELGVRDLSPSRAFYVDCLGYLITDQHKDALYLRAVEERNHHSIVLSVTDAPCVQALGFKLASEEDLDRAAFYFARKGLPTAFPEVPYQGRTLRTVDPLGMPLDFYVRMDQAESMLRQYAHHRGARIQRIDHINCFTSDVQASYEFYSDIGFRLTEYTETDDPNPKLWAVWLHRKGNVHDVAFTNGVGPRLHHIGVWTASALDILHICDVMASSGYLANMERGPGRHGISNALLPLHPRSRRPPRRAVHLGLSHGRSRPQAAALVVARSATADAVGPSGAEVVVRGRLLLRRRAAAPAGAGGAADRGKVT
jgi:catechol 2,3-dioxygenase